MTQTASNGASNSTHSVVLQLEKNSVSTDQKTTASQTSAELHPFTAYVLFHFNCFIYVLIPF